MMGGIGYLVKLIHVRDSHTSAYSERRADLIDFFRTDPNQQHSRRRSLIETRPRD